MKQRSGHRVVALSVVLTAMIVAGLSAGLRIGKAQSGQTQPDYSNVRDFVGSTHLLRDDDLVMTFTYQNSSNEPRQVIFTAGTANSNANPLNFSGQTIIPNGAAGCTNPNGCYFDYHEYDSLVPGTGRFFNTDRDTTVLYPFQFSTNNEPYILFMGGQVVPTGQAGLTWTGYQDVGFVIGATKFFAAAADFNHDGYDELLMAYSNPLVGPSNPKMRLATAVDPNDPTKGFNFGPEFSLSNPYGIRQIVIGDFNGDGFPEIASLYADPSGTLYLATYSVDPTSLTISNGGQVALQNLGDTFEHPLQVTAGHFTGSSHDQVVVGLQALAGTNYRGHFIDFDSNSIQPELVSSTDIVNLNGQTPATQLKLKSGRLNWSSTTDQIVMLFSASESFVGYTELAILVVDPITQTITKKADLLPFNPGQFFFLGHDVAFGNFDNMQQGMNGPERDPDLQIAMLGAASSIITPGNYGAGALFIFNVSEDLSTLTQVSSQLLDTSYFGGNQITDMSIAPVDLQGRSYRVGAPTVLQLESNVAPSVIAAMPPMHADFVPQAGATAPTLFNMSFVPDSFNTVFSMTDSSTNQSSTTSGTSWSFGAKETFSYGNEIGDVDAGDGTSFKATVSASQKLKGKNDTEHGTYSSNQFNLQAQTVYGDNVFYSSNRFTIWIYPITDVTVCPAGKPNCQPSEKVPATIQFSAPDQIDNPPVESGPGIEWYQPPWEPGNIFSYPASFSQLQQIVGLDRITQQPTINVLSQSVTLSADSLKSTVAVNWQNQQTDGSTASTQAKFSFDASFSASFAGGLPLVDKGTFTTDIDVSGSTGFSQLKTKSTQLGKSNGITINKPTIPGQDLYSYTFSPYIFGRQQSGGVVDNQPLATDVTTIGLLQTAFIVNPLKQNVSNWWSQTYNIPDVALNHPSRWQLTKPPLSSPIPGNCLTWDGSSQMDCLEKNIDSPGDPWTSPFHFLRGFFVSSINNPNQGPNLGTAVNGDQLALTTRVYNYSFQPMPPDSTVHVRFYGQQWATDDSNGGVSNTPIGNSFLIGETSVDPIPPFNPLTPNAPLNWNFATVKFDTTPYSDRYITFFVVVWIQNKDGSIGSEMAFHGLNKFDPSKPINSFSDLAAFEEEYGNNIGFYNSAFYVFAKPPATLNRKLGTKANTTPELHMSAVKTSASSIKPGERLEITATLQTGDQGVAAVTARFFDGDPANGGKVFDSERIAYIRPNARYGLRILFPLSDCGSHQIFVQVANGRPYAVSGQSPTFQVECPTPICVSQVCMRSPQYYSLHLDRLPRGVVTVIGNGLNGRVSTSDTTQMGLLLNGGTSRQQQLNQQFVATQLNLLAQAGSSQTALQSNLLCYGLNFQPTQLSTGFSLTPSATLAELFNQVQLAGRSGNLIDQRVLANLLEMLNGDDPTGRCK